MSTTFKLSHCKAGGEIEDPTFVILADMHHFQKYFVDKQDDARVKVFFVRAIYLGARKRWR